MTVDVAIEIRLQLGRRWEEIEADGHQLPTASETLPGNGPE
jgi:hypothetical protein